MLEFKTWILFYALISNPGMMPEWNHFDKKLTKSECTNHVRTLYDRLPEDLKRIDKEKGIVYFMNPDNQTQMLAVACVNQVKEYYVNLK